MRKSFSILLFISLSIYSFAQRREIGLSIGTTNYRGDLAPRVQTPNSRLGFDFSNRYIVNPAWMLRQSLFVGIFQASDQKLSDPILKNRGLEMSALFVSGNFLLEYYFFNFRSTKYGGKKFSPYLFVGLGAGFASVSEQKTAKTQSLFLPTLPYGIGIRKAVGEKWTYGLEFTTYQTFTDQFDLTSFANGGTTERNDVAYSVALTMTYRFVDVTCPKCIPKEPWLYGFGTK